MTITINGKDMGNELARVAEVIQDLGVSAAVIRDFDTATWFHSRFNRQMDMRYVMDELAPSFRSQGQLKPGLGCPGPEPGTFECPIGNHSLAACRLNGMPFKARVLDHVPSDAEKIKIITTDNVKQKRMTLFNIADALRQYARASGCTQGEAAALLEIDESLASKALTVDEGLAPELRPQVESGDLGSSFSYLLSTLKDVPTQIDLAERVKKGLKRDALAKIVRQINGGKQTKARSLTHKDGPACVVLPTNWPGEKIVEWLAARLRAAKDWLRKGVPPEKWGAL
jgi:ParB-like chromosome segregation protein Spo0J